MVRALALALLLVASPAWALTIPEAIEVLVPAAVPGVSYRVTDSGSGAAITFWDTGTLGTQPTPAQIAAVTQGQLDAARTGKLRALAKALYATTEQIGKALRCFADVVKDEVNILRAEVVGVQTAVWDPASISNGAGLTSPTVTVTGAAFGDQVLVAAPYSLQGLTATGSVVSANTVVLRLENQTGGAVNLASGTWTGIVVRHTAKAPRTTAQLRTAIDACIDGGTQD